jgi:hypothetical protein
MKNVGGFGFRFSSVSSPNLRASKYEGVHDAVAAKQGRLSTSMDAKPSAAKKARFSQTVEISRPSPAKRVRPSLETALELSSPLKRRTSFPRAVEKYSVEDGRVLDTYASQSSASRASGIAQTAISAACRGKEGTNTVGGFGWRFQGALSEKIDRSEEDDDGGEHDAVSSLGRKGCSKKEDLKL